METTFSQIQRAAYLRWEYRGRTHGHDRNDWIAAERQHRFATNYRVIARRPGKDESEMTAEGRLATRCRFCQQRVEVIPSANRASHLDTLGLRFLTARDECEECAGMFTEGIDRDLASFLAAPGSSGISVGAYKGLVRLALTILPLRDLEEHEDTIEWLSNPDHNFDFRVFSGLSCVISHLDENYPSSWVAVASKTNEREPWPSLLMFLGLDRRAFLVSIPLNPQDQDFDLSGESLPDVDAPSPFVWQPEVVSRETIAIHPDRSAERRVLAMHS